MNSICIDPRDGCAGRDLPFTNNYGVWMDEFRALGLEHTLEVSWEDAICYFGEGRQVRVGRGYGRCENPGELRRSSITLLLERIHFKQV
jgi:hypothetical protein